MATYAIGDIHGCRGTFEDLLAKIKFNAANDTLWLTGDLVNRGPDSLGVLRWVYHHRHCVRLVLGNHDLHLLAAYVGAREIDKNDELQTVLQAEDANVLCDFLRAQPLMYAEGDYVLLHAGRLPEWDISTAQTLAAAVSARIANDDDFLRVMYGNFPVRWHPSLSADKCARLVINAFTRMRLLSLDGAMLLSYAGVLEQRPQYSVPWFDAPHRRRWSAITICGHWSALGLRMRTDLLAIDTGCLWGGQLTAIRLQDQKVFQVAARKDEIMIK